MHKVLYKTMIYRLLIAVMVGVSAGFFPLLQAQSIGIDSTQTATDSLHKDSVKISADSLEIAVNDSLSAQNDSLNIDSSAVFKTAKNAIDAIITYSAEDSVTFDIKLSMAYLHDSCNLEYEDSKLYSDYVEIDFEKRELYAKGVADTAENLAGTPVFKQGSYEIKSEELRYNFNSKKGLIYKVITQEGESYLHGAIVKKNADNTSFIRHGKYTTCNLTHPHFEIDFGKAKVIPNDKIVTGPLYLRVADIPVPLGLPFGIFPNTQKQKNGFLMPNDYGVEEQRDMGLFIKGLGYYFSVKDRIDFAITATIYTRGAFGLNWKSNYVKRYKFNGNFELEYLFTPKGERKTENFYVAHEFKVVLQHNQDAKAHPRNRFSANINFRTSDAPTTAMASYEDITNNHSESSVSFTTSWGNLFNFGINADIRQDFQNITDSARRNERNQFTLSLPNINFNISQFYPFRRKKVVGKLRFWENISMQYTLDIKDNMFYSYDSALITSLKSRAPQFNIGVNHVIPLKSTIKIFKHLSWENSVSLTESWSFKGIHKTWYKDTNGYGKTSIDTNWGFWAAHNLSISSSLSTTLYGMWSLKKGRVQAFRHTLTPSVSFSYRPGVNKKLYNTYYDSIRSQNYPLQGGEVRYSVLEGVSMFGIPAYKTSASINFSISNRLEVKVKPKNEGESMKKITLLESFSLSTSYDFAADSLKWQPLSLSARTLLFKIINVAMSMNFDPYCIQRIDSNSAVRVNKLEIKENHRLFRFSSMSWDVSFGLTLNPEFFRSKNKSGEKKEVESPSKFGNWNISISYVLAYNMNDNYYYYLYHDRRNDTVFLKYNKNITTSVSVQGDIEITPKWKIGFRTGYDFINKTISFSEFEIERDLHCWKMGIKWRPFGTYRGFEFNIQAKANILKDAKYSRKKNYSE